PTPISRTSTSAPTSTSAAPLSSSRRSRTAGVRCASVTPCGWPRGPTSPPAHASRSRKPEARCWWWSVHPRSDGPSAIAWSVALMSGVLAWPGVGTGLTGAWYIAQGDRTGWWWVGSGIAMLIADVLIDFVWAHPSVSKSDLPDLNRRADQLVGRVLVLEQAI